jgi:hypothetical protein
MTFPCSYCNDGGGASTTCCPTGRRRSRASPSGTEFYERELKPLGFKVTAQVVSYEGGVPVNITMYPKW